MFQGHAKVTERTANQGCDNNTGSDLVMEINNTR